jgi:hypothetical protein
MRARARASREILTPPLLFLFDPSYSNHPADTVQERVEEELFVRELEKKYFTQRRTELEREAKEGQLRRLVPVMAHAEELLRRSGDEVSDAGLEAVARWKLDNPDESTLH